MTDSPVPGLAGRFRGGRTECTVPQMDRLLAWALCREVAHRLLLARLGRKDVSDVIVGAESGLRAWMRKLGIDWDRFRDQD